MVDLFSREYGSAEMPPLVILHGLLGSSRNWQMAAKALADRFHVHCLDLRNHGESPWADEESYEAMAEDVLAWMDGYLDRRPYLMGHSMGGKLAMKLACEHTERIRKLIVVDISPRLYAGTHGKEFVGMRSIDLERLSSRSEAEALLEAEVKDWGMRKFLLTNLLRTEDGKTFRWQVNLDAIEPALPELEKTSLEEEQSYEGEAIFIMGGKSPYFSKEDMPVIRRHFPASAIEVIPESGHNPHFECRDQFVALVNEFANSGIC